MSGTVTKEVAGHHGDKQVLDTGALAGSSSPTVAGYGRKHSELFGRAFGLPDEVEKADRRYAGTRADQLSGCTLAKLNLGLSPLPDPPVLLLTSRTPVSTGTRPSRSGRSVLIISHFVTDLERFDRVLELSNGKVVAR
jgi:ABC-2 type transport system ATP-binding protein